MPGNRQRYLRAWLQVSIDVGIERGRRHLAGIEVAGGESTGKPEEVMAIAEGNPKC